MTITDILADLEAKAKRAIKSPEPFDRVSVKADRILALVGWGREIERFLNWISDVHAEQQVIPFDIVREAVRLADHLDAGEK